MGQEDETKVIERRRPVSLSTPVTVGVIVSIAGGVVAAIWWRLP